MLRQVLNKKCQIASDTSCAFPAYTGYVLLLRVQERSRSARLREFSGRESNCRAGFGGGQGAGCHKQAHDLSRQKSWKRARLLGWQPACSLPCRETRRVRICPSPQSPG